MNGRTFTFGLLAGLVVAGAMRRRGSRTALWPDADGLADDFTRTMHSATESQMKHWAKQHGLRYIGSGESRAVFARPRGESVLKLVFSSYGQEANRDEAQAWREVAPRIRIHLVPVLDVDPIGRWLVMERVKTRSMNEPLPPATPLALAIKAELRECGFCDLLEDNVAADGRLLDYGMHLWQRWSASCRN